MEALKQLEALVSAKIAIVKTLCSLVSLETRLAGLSVFPLLLNLSMLFVVFSTVWLSAMFLMGYLILWASDCILLSLGLVLLLNLGLFWGLLKYLSFNLKNMSFQKTRDYFSQNKSAEHEKLKNADNSTN